MNYKRMIEAYNQGENIPEQIQPEHSVELESKEFRMALLNREKIPGNLLKVKKDEL